LKKTTLFLLILIFISLGLGLSAQNYKLNNGLNGSVITTCSGNFYDSGGAAGNYNNNQNLTVTFCPSVSGQVITVSFSQLQVENTFDRLRVYDGPTTASPLIANNTGNVGAISFTSSTGCLTFNFTSDGSITQAGWQGVITCGAIPPCSGSVPACPSGFPDACANACPLSLSTPPNCNTAASNTFCLDNTGASQEAGSYALNGCSPSGNIPQNPFDIWFSFTATSTAVTLSLIGLTSPTMALYQGTCGALVGFACATGSGSADISVSSLSVGQTYFLQIAVADPLDVGEVTLIVNSVQACNPCLLSANLSVSPTPIGGSYTPGTVVQFCYQMSDWNQVSTNWFHALGLTLGNGWDPASLNVVSLPPSCSNSGVWAFYNSVTSSNTGQTIGPGFFFETNGSVDGNPGNNFGDNCTNVVNPWVFCWELTVADCGPLGSSAAANILVNSYGDSESGSWTATACQNDPNYAIFASVDCCEEPLLISTTPANCGVCNGEISIQANGTAPYAYVCIDSNGVTVASGNSFSPNITMTGLCGNENFTVQTTDDTGCISSITAFVSEPSAPTAVISGAANLCPGQTTNIQVALTGTGPWALTYSVNGTPQTVNVPTSPYVITNAPNGLYSLISLTDAVCSNSISGTALVQTISLTATLSGGGIICVGDNIDLSVAFTGSGPWTIVAALNGVPFPSQVVSSNPFIINVNQPGTYTLVSVSNASCAGIVSGSAIVTQAPAVNAVISGNLDLCTGATGTLNIALNGTPPWNILYQLNGVTQPGITTSNANYALNVSQAGTYTLLSIDDAQCSGTISGTASVTIHNSPTLSNLQETCNGFSYTVTFTIQDGDPTSYTVSGAGTLSGTQFLSDPITSGTPYSFQVSDGNSCATETISGTVNCGCPATAVLSGGGTVCPGEDVYITLTLAGNGPWNVIYTQDGIVQPLLNIASSPYSIPGLSPGNYALASVMDQDCLGNISGLANIGFYPAASANMSGNETLCDGESTLFDVQLTGTAPWNISYAIDGIDQSPSLTSDPNFQLNASSAGLYILNSVTDLNCDASLSGTATLTILPNPSATMAGDAALCPGENAEISITFTGAAPFDFNFTLDGIDQGSLTSILNSYTLNTALEGQYILTQVYDASCTGTASGQFNVIVYEAPTASASGNVELCNGEVGTVDVIFEGIGPWVLDYTVAGIAQDPLIMNSSPSALTLDANGPYQLIDVSDVYCDGTADGNISVTYFPLPTAVLPIDQSYCEGESLDWNITLSGTGPWDLLLQWNGADWQSIQSDDPVIPIQTSNAGQVSIFSMSDAHCDAANLSSFEINSLDLPTASILGSDLLCEGSNGEIEVILQGSPPFSFDLNVNGLGQGNYISNTNSLIIPISQAGEFDLINLVDEFCAGELGPSLSVFAQELPNASILGDFLLCQGTDTLIPISFSGQGPFSFDYSINGMAQGTIITTGPIYEFPSTVSGNYQLIAVSDAFCDGTVNGIASILFYPDINIAGLSDTSICIGSSFFVNPILSGGQGTGYEFIWSGPGISSDMSAIQLSPNENSNFTFEVTDGCGMVYSEDISVLVTPSPVLSAQVMNGPLCGPGQVLIQETSPDISDNGYCYWYAQGDTIFNCSGAQFFISGTGNIDVGFYAEPVPGCISDTVFQGFIEILELPHADFEYDPKEPSNAENIIQFVNFSIDAHQYEWFLDAQLFSEQQFPSLSLPFSEIPEFYTICLVATNENLCTDTLCTIIPTTNELLVYVPSAFTPDNDGVNDHFKPVLHSADIDKYSFSIFDRWGNIIWETQDVNAGWNGAGSEESTYSSPDGIYTWKIQVRRVGTTDERVYLGMVTLIR